MKTIKIINKNTNEECEAIQYTGNHTDIISFIGAPNNFWYINEDFILNPLSSYLEVVKYNDYIIKYKNGDCHLCKCESMFNCFKEI